MDVDIPMGNIVVAAKHQPGPLFLQFTEISKHLIQPLIFIALSLLAAGPRWEIGIYQAEIAKVQLDHPAFVVADGMPRPIDHLVGLDLRKDGNAAIALLLCREPVVMISQAGK